MAEEKLHPGKWFPFYSSDFIGATVGLSCQERAIYALMVPLYYEIGPFPVDRVRVYRIVGCESDEQKRTVDFLLEKFFVLREDGWYQPRAEREKVKMAQVSQKARDKANKRWQSRAAAQDAAALLEHSQRSARAMPSTTTTTTTATENRKESARPSAAPSRAKFARPSHVSEQVWNDFLKTRAKHRAEVTDTAMRGIQEQADRAGISLEDALRICCVKGWRSFDAGWNWRSEYAKLSPEDTAQEALRLLEARDGKA